MVRALSNVDIKEAKKFVKIEDQWIFEANCLHLASQFHPKSLDVLLGNLENTKALLKQAHANGKTSPLHVAPLRVDSLSTW